MVTDTLKTEIGWDDNKPLDRREEMKKKLKMAPIDCCWICPHFGYKNNIDYCYQKRKRLPKESNLEKIFPEWCPLPDYKTQTPKEAG